MTAGWLPDVGDLVQLTFDGNKGTEQGGFRPALVVSPRSFSLFTSLAIVCPITTRVRNYPTSVVIPLPDGMDDEAARRQGIVHGEILVAHVRSVSIAARSMRPCGQSAAPEILGEARRILGLIIPTEPG